MTKEVEVRDAADNIPSGAGLFVESLYRNNRQIRKDRADQIIEDAQIRYKRECEDLSLAIKKLERERQSMLDLSPTDAKSLVLASDFDSKSYIDKDIEIGVKIRNLSIKLDIATQRYTELFGAKISL